MNTVIEQIVDAERATRPKFLIAERFPVKGSDGKFYTGDMPHGVESTGERGAPYYVRQCPRQGTTHGERFESRAAIESDMVHRSVAADGEFRTTLERMTPAELEAQRNFWLPEAPTVAGNAVRFNSEHDGVEVSFPGKPIPDTISALKREGFRWSPRSKVWYKRFASRAWAAAHRIAGVELAPEPKRGFSEPDRFDMAVEDGMARQCGV